MPRSTTIRVVDASQERTCRSCEARVIVGSVMHLVVDTHGRRCYCSAPCLERGERAATVDTGLDLRGLRR